MNVVTNLIERIEDYRLTNKNPCKSYATKENAEQTAQRLAQWFANYYARPNEVVPPCRYIVAFNEAWGRWVVAFDFTELFGRKHFTGGYIGIASAKGFYTY